MTTWREMDARDKVVIWLGAIVGLFLLISVVGVLLITMTDRDPGEVWSRIFDLVNVLAGGLLGYVTGATIERGRKT